MLGRYSLRVTEAADEDRLADLCGGVGGRTGISISSSSISSNSSSVMLIWVCGIGIFDVLAWTKAWSSSPMSIALSGALSVEEWALFR